MSRNTQLSCTNMRRQHNIHRNIFTHTHIYIYILGPPVVPFYIFLWGKVSPTKIDYRKKGTVIVSSLLEDLDIYIYIYMHSRSTGLAPAFQEPVVQRHHPVKVPRTPSGVKPNASAYVCQYTVCHGKHIVWLLAA